MSLTIWGKLTIVNPTLDLGSGIYDVKKAGPPSLAVTAFLCRLAMTLTGSDRAFAEPLVFFGQE